MRCSGCGKDIPFAGTVCPYCQRDKSKDQSYTVVAFILGIISGAVGYFIFGFWGALGGFFLGCIVAAFATLSGDTKPPEVQIVPPSVLPTVQGSPASRLAQLKELHERGLLSPEEFSNKKAAILAEL